MFLTSRSRKLSESNTVSTFCISWESKTARIKVNRFEYCMSLKSNTDGSRLMGLMVMPDAMRHQSCSLTSCSPTQILFQVQTQSESGIILVCQSSSLRQHYEIPASFNSLAVGHVGSTFRNSDVQL